MKDSYINKFWRKAIPEAGKKIRVLSNRALEQNLEFAAGSLAEAFRQGVEEAQGEIVSRLRELQAKLAKHPGSA